MPTRPRRPCGHPGCRALVASGYCDTHAPLHARPAWATTVTSSTARGYGARWQRLRRFILARDPICATCHREASVEVDHVLSKAAGGTDDEANLRGLCGPCHARKTARDARAGRSASTPRRGRSK